VSTARVVRFVVGVVAFGLLMGNRPATLWGRKKITKKAHAGRGQETKWEISNDMKTTLMIVLCSAALLMSGCATSHSHSTAWEYKVLHYPGAAGIEGALNQLASDGWVVVSANAAAEGGPPSTWVLVILKRHK
jgi:hypothetical protein